jgi:serine/threonine protein kinase
MGRNGSCMQICFLLLVVYAAAVERVVWAQTTSAPPYVPVDNILISCGSSTNLTVDGGRVFQADNTAKTLASGGVSASISQPSPNLLYPTLMQQARFFTTNSSYTFTVTPGRHWIRLYFYPFAFANWAANASLFSVTANQFVLLDDFRPSSWTTPDFPSLFREYAVNVSSESLILGFDPAPGSYAFINALEVVSMPSDLYTDDASLLGQAGSITPLGLADCAIQAMFHINVGGASVSPQNDSTGMWRTWQPDDLFIFSAAVGTTGDVPVTSIEYPSTLPEYIAPATVYATAREMGGSNTINQNFNLTWIFPVDLGYTYFVRLHFCEIFLSAINQRVFNVYINNQTADTAMDIIALTGHPDWPLYQDFAVPMFKGSSELWLQIGPTPTSTSQYRDAILNGVEILKLNNSDGSLSGVNPSIIITNPDASPAVTKASSSSSSSGAVVGAAVGSSIAAVLLSVCICYYFCCSRKSKVFAKHAARGWQPMPQVGSSDTTTTTTTTNQSKIISSSHKSGTGSYISSSVAGSSSLGRYFTFAELQEATNNFDESWILGVGGFGKVYKGEIDDGTKVAVKRGNPRSEQGLTEFQTEIELLSKLRHRHLVSLIGYCDEHYEMILIYDYMANGPLRGHLYGTELPSLSWKQRLEICIGAARGLHYLHTGAAQSIIHRDVKTTNILLDENLVAKVADFGLSKTGPTLEQTHISTAVKGSFGYLDPEYFRRQQLTEKSDVYSFGVVLMEVLCARPAINPTLPREQVNIAEWAMQKQKQGLLATIMDPYLMGTCNPASLRKFGDTAEKCLQEQGIDRPAMGDVLWNLEYALQLQENSLQPNLMDASTELGSLIPVAVPTHPIDDDDDDDDRSKVTGISDAHSFGSVDDLEDASASAVFSQLVNPQGR